MAETAVERRVSTGECEFCHGTFAKNAITRHLAKCPVRGQRIAEADSAAKSQNLYHLLVEGRYLKDYWLHLEVPGNSTLEVLDSFLRRTWLECCGHLSSFTLEGENYSVDPEPGWGVEERSMNVKLDRVLRKGLKFEYQYDYGSTTHLTLKVVDSRSGPPLQKGVLLMARNHPPEIRCRCGQPAAYVHTWKEATYCPDCYEEDEEAEEGCLPVVNSPRCGVCGYTG